MLHTCTLLAELIHTCHTPVAAFTIAILIMCMGVIPRMLLHIAIPPTMQVQKIATKDASMTNAQQIHRLTKEGSRYLNLNPFEVCLLAATRTMHVCHGGWVDGCAIGHGVPSVTQLVAWHRLHTKQLGGVL